MPREYCTVYMVTDSECKVHHFRQEKDAIAFAGRIGSTHFVSRKLVALTKLKNGHVHIVGSRVYQSLEELEKGLNEEVRQRALDKLTPEERKVLGLE